MLKIAEYSKQVQEICARAEEALKGTEYRCPPPSDETRPLNIVFVGQYSAGKSTIIRMLTGRNDIAVGAGITTERTNSYFWNGMVITDTPGIHTEQRPDHDEISYRAIAAADVLIFVVTSQMFDANIASHFRKLAIDNDKANEMILVVNKMQMTAEGNTPHQQEIIRGDIVKVIAPYTPEELHLCFLDAKSYLDGAVRMAASPERAERLIRRSGCAEFTDTINRFIAEKGYVSRLTTELYQIEDVLQRAINALELKSENEDLNALEENFVQQRYMLSDARNRLRRDIRSLFSNTSNKIREAGLDAAELVNSGEKAEEIEIKLSQKIEEANTAATDCQQQAQEILRKGLSDVEQDISEADNSAFTMQLKSRLENNIGTLPENIRNLLINAGGFMKGVGDILVQNAVNPENAGIKLACYSGGNVHKAVLDIGNAFNVKFKPWQAEKIARGLARAGKVMDVLGVVLDIGLQIKDDYAAETQRRELKKFCQSVRAEFYGFAGELVDFGRVFAEEQLNNALGGTISELDEKIEVIRSANAAQNETSAALRTLLNECRGLIQEIHRG